MDSIRRTITILTITLVFDAVAHTPAGFAQEHSFRMPQYADADPPPPRTREEIKKLLAGSDKAGAESKKSSAAPLRVVLVAGPKDHGKGEHDYPAWQKVWSRLLAEAAATSVDTASEFPSSQQIKSRRRTRVLPARQLER